MRENRAKHGQSSPWYSLPYRFRAGETSHRTVEVSGPPPSIGIRIGGQLPRPVIQSLMAAMVQVLKTFALVMSLVIPMAGGAWAQPASANDTARLLAGM